MSELLRIIVELGAYIKALEHQVSQLQAQVATLQASKKEE